MIVDWCTYVNLKESYSVLQLFIPNMSKNLINMQILKFAIDL